MMAAVISNMYHSELHIYYQLQLLLSCKSFFLFLREHKALA